MLSVQVHIWRAQQGNRHGFHLHNDSVASRIETFQPHPARAHSYWVWRLNPIYVHLALVVVSANSGNPIQHPMITLTTTLRTCTIGAGCTLPPVAHICPTPALDGLCFPI